MAIPTTQSIVLDTNIVLDLWVFADAQAGPLRRELERGGLHWIATAPMRAEFERVLGYPQIASRLAGHGQSVAALLETFDHNARIVAVPAKAPVTCGDPDDQMFIDLAFAHRCLLLSKDAAVLSMTKRLAALQVGVAATLAASSYTAPAS